jgi:glycosyltransferase, MGT family
MARYLVYTSPHRGHFQPPVATLQELARRDHEISIRTLAAGADEVRGLGFSASAVDPAIEAIKPQDRSTRTPFGASRAMMQHLIDQAELAVGDCAAAIEEEKPDAVIVDMHSFGGAFAAEASGVPWGFYSGVLPSFPSRDTPPFGPGFKPRKDVIGRVRDWTFRQIGAAPFKRMARTNFDRIRAQVGLPPQDGLLEHVLAAQVAVFYTAEPFEYPRSDWPASVRLVGPGLWDPPADPPAWLDEIDAPLVLVTASTDFNDDGAMIEMALDALADENVFVVATTAALNPSRFSAPANARVERFIPHGPIVARASCVLCHGGVGIVQKALAAAVPVCAVPFGRDNLEVARRLEVADAGTFVPGWRLRPDRLRTGVLEAMQQREGARRIAEAFAAAGGPVAAADAFEELLPAGVRT